MVKHQKVSKYYERDNGFPLNDNFLTIFGDIKIFGDLKIHVRFTLKELKCELSSSFDIISNSKREVLQIEVIFEIKKRNENKRKHQVLEFFTNMKKKDHSII